MLSLQLKIPGMKHKKIRQYNWRFLIPQFSILLLIGLFFYVLKIERYWLLSLAIYFLLSGYLKIVIPRLHRKGLYYLRKGEYEGAVYAFQKSYRYFSKHRWIDEYRAFTLFSISYLSYREMALMNIIYCYQQLGKNEDAKRLHKRLSAEFPQNSYSL